MTLAILDLYGGIILVRFGQRVAELCPF